MYKIKDKNIIISENTKTIGKHTFFENGTLHDINTLLFIYYHLLHIEDILFIDIGAHCGVFSLLIGQIPNSTIYAFEPNPEVFECLQENIQLNNLSNIKAHNIGLGDKIEEKELNICINHSGLSTFGTNLTRFTQDTNKKKVQVQTLDSFTFDKIDCIKIDTEGFEYYILKGGIQTIQKHKPNILLEIYNDNLKQTNVNQKDLEYILKYLGYHKTHCIDQENFFFIYFKPTIVSNYKELLHTIQDTTHNNDILYMEYDYQLNPYFIQTYANINKLYDILFLEKGNSFLEEKLEEKIQENNNILFIEYQPNKLSIRNTNNFLLSKKCITLIRKFLTIFPLELEYTLEEFLDFMTLSLSLKICWTN
jgi:FkbM family methyltransferase